MRSCKINGLDIKKKQAIGLLDGTIVAVQDTPKDVLNEVLGKAKLDKAEILTIYYGEDTEKQRPRHAARISEKNTRILRLK